MDQMNCLTNHREDLCHDGGNFNSKRNGISNSHALYDDILRGCGVRPAVNTSMRQMNSYEWSRLGPMGYLLEPKLYPINVSSTSGPIENCIETRNGQRTTDEECDLPLTTEPISPLPPADILRRINEDRMRSTYQSDFGDMDDYPWADYDNIMISAGYKTGRASVKPREEIKCRERARPPYLNGHEIPGRRPKDSSVFTSIGSTRITARRRSGPQDENLPPRPPVRPKRVSSKPRKINDDYDNDLGGGGFGIRDQNDHQSDRRTMFEDVTADRRRQISKAAPGNGRSSILGAPRSDNERIKLKDATGDGEDQISERVADGGRSRILEDPTNDDIRKHSKGTIRDFTNRISENVTGYKERTVIEGGVSDARRKIYGEPADDNNTLTSGDNKGSIHARSTNNDRQNSINKQTSDTHKNSYVKKDDREVSKIYKDTKKSRKHMMPGSGKVKINSEELELLPSMPWTSEYQDIISRTADDILRSKLHYYGKLRLITPNPDCP